MRLPSDLDVLRRRDFRLVFGASLVSVLGDGVLTVALTFAVLDLTGSPGACSPARRCCASRRGARCSSPLRSE